MRWRSATDEVVASSAVTSSTATTLRSSRRSLNEQTDDGTNGSQNPSSDETEDENGVKVTDSSAISSSSMSAISRGQKRSLEVEKKNALGSGVDPPESADTSTGRDTTTTTAQQNNSVSGDASNVSPDKSNDDVEDDEDDDGADHAEDYPPLMPTITWKPQNVQSTCEFTHTILDYAQKRESGCKKAEYSAITQDELGNRWRLIVYVNGNGRASNHHLSLFLQVADAEDLPFGWKKAVSYVLTLEHPTNPSELSYAKRNPDKTFKLCPKAIDWGWSQFITSDRIQQEGFVKLDTLTVRAQVSVKSSSVVIDEEDAELYLKCAVEEGDANSVKLCLDHGASVNCHFKDDLYTPLHTACSSGSSSGSLEVLNLLLLSGADCNACNKWKETPLLIAANNGHKAAVEALLEHGADPSLCSEAGWSALTFAAHKGYDDIVDLLLKKGAPVNCAVTEDSSTPLHKACAGSKPGHLASVKLLLAGNADVHALNKWRETPLLTAANHGQAGAVEALLAHDADPCKCTDTGWSPLSIAAYKGHDAVVRLLLEEGAPTEEDDPTLSALLQAATKGLPDTVELLLRHGADHTVTTKKGDTALSILVEQNLIDAAVEMVTEYNASIPRCSRDRKKVQRARLLINLRMKHLRGDGKDDNDSTDDEEETDEDRDANIAQHIENGSADGSSATKTEKKKKEKPKESLEAKARLAEEALLQELEKEDALAKVEEAKANNKNAKKKKKKERERLQKLKEDEARRKKEEEELKERERIRLEKEEQRRRQRDEQKKAEEERTFKEMMEKEKVMAAKRKEREAREQSERVEKPRNQRGSGSVSPTESTGRLGSKPNNRTSTTDPTPSRKIVSLKDSKKPSLPSPGSRRWESATKGIASQSNAIPGHKIPMSKSFSEGKTALPLLPRVSRSTTSDVASVVSHSKSSPSVSPPTQAVGPLQGVQTSPLQFVATDLEHPAVALFRREKVAELFQRCTLAVALFGELVLKRIIYRWIVRVSHGKDAFVDPIIPSWIDSEQLITFFHRQFITESLRSHGGSVAGYSMESLKDVGTVTAHICQDLAKQVVLFRHRIDEELPVNWTDTDLGMSASDGTLTGRGSVVTLFWANKAHVFLPSLTFATLKDRYAGVSNRFLAATFVSKILYETFQFIVANTSMELCLPPSTLAVLSSELGVSAVLWSDPFLTQGSKVFWGHFEHVDVLFGGQKPFSKDDHGSEEILARHGGSVCAFLPMDPSVAARYVQRMVDILDLACISGAALSFAVFLHSDCRVDTPLDPVSIDLRAFDPRLGDQQSAYISRLDVLAANNHSFASQEDPGSRKNSTTSSYFLVLQNEAGRSRFNVSEVSASRILATLLIQQPGINDFSPPIFSQPSYFDAVDPISTDTQRAMGSDYGTIGGSSLLDSFSQGNATLRRAGHRGRLFDLVDDGDEDQLNDDIMSGMLNNLDVGFFQNSNVGADGVDIEAISLMGIGGPPRSLGNQGHAYPGPRF